MARGDLLVYDVGLHKGEDTEFYLKMGYRVVAFEANPALVAICRERFHAEIEAGQLEIVEGAIASGSTERIAFYVNEDVSVWGTIDDNWVHRNDARGTKSRKIEVNRVDFTACLAKFGVPFYLKVDIEGADWIVLNALASLDERPQYVSFEINSVSPEQIERDVETLWQLGYKYFQMVPQGAIAGSLIECRDVEGEKVQHTFGQDASGPFGEDLLGAWNDRRQILQLPLHDGWQDIHAGQEVAGSRTNLVNVALNKPATQSSTSSWSTSPIAEVDAKIANDGDVLSDRYFHTAVELNPWWQVDLQDIYYIRRIAIYNRAEAQARLQNFLISTSVDGLRFVNILRVKGHIFSIFCSEVLKECVGRYVRVTLEGEECLHFRECQIFGSLVQ